MNWYISYAMFSLLMLSSKLCTNHFVYHLPPNRFKFPFRWSLCFGKKLGRARLDPNVYTCPSPRIISTVSQLTEDENAADDNLYVSSNPGMLTLIFVSIYMPKICTMTPVVKCRWRFIQTCSSCRVSSIPKTSSERETVVEWQNIVNCFEGTYAYRITYDSEVSCPS